MRFTFGDQKKNLLDYSESEWEKLRPRWKQVHGVNCAEVFHANQECGEVDAVWTQSPSLPIAVVTADCVPLLLFRDDRKAVAAIHAGWRGIGQRIVLRFFESLPRGLGTPSDWNAMIGPSIRACCYEVSEELIEQFKKQFSELTPNQISPSDRKLDLLAPIKCDLDSLGVKIHSVHPDCTYCARDENGAHRYFSYRRGDRNSRQYSMIELRF